MEKKDYHPTPEHKYTLTYSKVPGTPITKPMVRKNPDGTETRITRREYKKQRADMKAVGKAVRSMRKRFDFPGTSDGNGMSGAASDCGAATGVRDDPRAGDLVGGGDK